MELPLWRVSSVVLVWVVSANGRLVPPALLPLVLDEPLVPQPPLVLGLVVPDAVRCPLGVDALLEPIVPPVVLGLVVPVREPTPAMSAWVVPVVPVPECIGLLPTFDCSVWRT